MVTRSNSWWMTRTKGIYIFSSSPFRQRAFAGFGNEMLNMVKQHWKGSIYFSSLVVGAYYLIVWANNYHHNDMRKDPVFFEREAIELGLAEGKSNE